MLRTLAICPMLFICSTTWSEEVNVAVAANFAAPMQLIAEAFEARTDHQLHLSFASSGSLYSQVVNGAPYGVFLSADQSTLDALQRSEMLVEESRFTYAVGGLVLWSADATRIDREASALVEGRFEHLAMANPQLAPYGQAAVDVLSELGLYEQIGSKLVMGENISQAYQFVVTGGAEMGFVALSQVMRNGEIASGSYWLVPRELYAPILQDAAILLGGSDNAAARDLVEFMRMSEAEQIVRSFGYLLLAHE